MELASTMRPAAAGPVEVRGGAPRGVIQRKCACAGKSGAAGSCEECNKEAEGVQRYSTTRETPVASILETAGGSADDVAPGWSAQLSGVAGHNFGRVAVGAPWAPAVRRRSISAELADGDDEQADRLAGSVSTAPADDLTAQGSAAPVARVAHGLVQRAAMPGAAPGPAAPAPASTAAEPSDSRQKSARALIIEDGAEEIGPGQMRKTAFLNQLESAVCATADQELVRVGRTARGCPYIERWIRYYRTRTSDHIQKAIVRYAPEAARATSARDFIPVVTDRIRRAVTVWATTGQITGVPEELAGQISGGGLLGAAARLASGVVGAVGGALGSIGRAIGGIFTKTRGGAPPQEADAERVRCRLGPGQGLDSSAKARMQGAMGHDFSSVRVHTDSRAAELSSELNARAFTVGSEVAFAAGEYQPGTLIGDALLAHELAHVVQQSAAHRTVTAQRSESTEYNALEEDADTSATKAILSLWSGAKRAFPNSAGKSSPSVKSGLRLSRCASGTGLKAVAVGMPAPSPAAVATCSPDAVTLDQVTQAAASVGVRVPEGRLPTILGITTAPLPLWKFTPRFVGGKCSVLLDTEPELSLTRFAYTKPGQYLVGKTSPDPERVGFSGQQVGKGCQGNLLPTYVKITPQASDKARRAEVEHCEDFRLAFALSYEKYRSALKAFAEDGAADPQDCQTKVLQSLTAKSGIDFGKWDDVGKCLWRRSGQRDVEPKKWHQWDLSGGSNKIEKDEATGECKQIILTPDHEANLVEVGKHPSNELIKDCGEK